MKADVKKGAMYRVNPYDGDCPFEVDDVVTVRDVVQWDIPYTILYLCVDKNGSIGYCIKEELEEI